MVNYCCVTGCGRNSKKSGQLNYYSLPKERHRQVEWLIAAGREDLIEKSLEKPTFRICSRHFPPSSLKNKHLIADAVPSLCLPNSCNGVASGEECENNQRKAHQDIFCNSCTNLIVGFRYKCVSCPDYDLCSKCEVMERHPQHYMLRIPTPLKFKVADDLAKQWQKFFNIQHIIPTNGNESSGDTDSDDEPIKKYSKSYDSGVDISEDMKIKIQNEVDRVLKLAKKKRKCSTVSNDRKRQKIIVESQQYSNSLSNSLPEVVFADVNNLTQSQLLDIKSDSHNVATEELLIPKMHVKLSDDLSELTIEVAEDPKNIFSCN